MSISFTQFKDIILDKEKFRINLIKILKETESDASFDGGDKGFPRLRLNNSRI